MIAAALGNEGSALILISRGANRGLENEDGLTAVEMTHLSRTDPRERIRDALLHPESLGVRVGKSPRSHEVRAAPHPRDFPTQDSLT